jgi:hypothetical protein
MFRVSASWASISLFHSVAVAVVFKHGYEQQPLTASQKQYADLMGDMMKDVAEITAKETLDHVSDELKTEVEAGDANTHVTVNDASNPVQWMKGFMKNVIGRTEDTLEQRVLETAQNAFDKNIDKNGNLINPAESYVHPDPSDQREPQMPSQDWASAQKIPEIPKEATGIFVPKPDKNPSQSTFPSGFGIYNSYIQQSEEKKSLPDDVNDVMSDVAADLNDLAQAGVVEKVKDVATKDYDADIAAKREELQNAKGLDWLKALGGVAKAEVADRMSDAAKGRAQKIFDNQVDSDGTPVQGTWADKISKIFGSPLKKKEQAATSASSPTSAATP